MHKSIILCLTFMLCLGLVQAEERTIQEVTKELRQANRQLVKSFKDDPKFNELKKVSDAALKDSLKVRKDRLAAKSEEAAALISKVEELTTQISEARKAKEVDKVKTLNQEKSTANKEINKLASKLKINKDEAVIVAMTRLKDAQKALKDYKDKKVAETPELKEINEKIKALDAERNKLRKK